MNQPEVKQLPYQEFLSRLQVQPSVLKEPTYFSGAQSQLYIGKTFVTGLVLLQFNESYSHQPYYGYKSEYYDKVFYGKCGVQGILSLNLLDSRLLDIICERNFGEEGKTNNYFGPNFSEAHLDSTLIEKTKNGEDIISYLDQVSDMVYANKMASPSAAASGLSDPRHATRVLKWMQSNSRFGIDLLINLGDPTEIANSWEEKRASTCDVIKNVVFTGQERRVSISSEVLMQNYTFIARNVEPALIGTYNKSALDTINSYLPNPTSETFSVPTLMPNQTPNIVNDYLPSPTRSIFIE